MLHMRFDYNKRGGNFAPRVDQGTLLASDGQVIYKTVVESESELLAIIKSRDVTFEKDRFLCSDLKMDSDDSASSWQASHDEMSDEE